MGTITVSVAGRRVRKMLAIASPVAQLLPQLKVKIDFTKIQSCTYHGSFRPSWLADRLDLLGRGQQAAQDLGRDRRRKT